MCGYIIINNTQTPLLKSMETFEREWKLLQLYVLLFVYTLGTHNNNIMYQQQY